MTSTSDNTIFNPLLTADDRIAILAGVKRDKPHPLAHIQPEDIGKALQDKVCSMMSPECLAVFKRTPRALRSHMLYNINRMTYDIKVGDGEGAAEFLTGVETAYRAYRDAFKTLEEELKKVRTRAKLVKLYPELAIYLPPAARKCNTLPARPVLEDIMKIKPITV